MRIVVCIKQVPDTTDIKWTENNTIQREGVESVINPFDEYALETAVRIKERYGAEVTAVTMGPPQADDILRKAIAMGCDDAILVSDRKFSGADTVATSRTLATAIKTKVPDVDLIICGQFATDGDTAQTGPSIAENLDMPQVTYVKEVAHLENQHITVKKEVEDGIETHKMRLPGLICMKKCDYELRPSKINGYIKAQNSIICQCDAQEINLDPSLAGIKGSPTYVSAAFRPEQKTQGEIVTHESPIEAANFIAFKIQEMDLSFVKAPIESGFDSDNMVEYRSSQDAASFIIDKIKDIAQ